jgi:hypothetical protein
MSHHFFNSKPPKAVEPLTKLVKPPCATNVEKIFAQEHQSELSETLKSELSKRGLKPTEGNFILSRMIKKAAYIQLSNAEKARYEMEATEYNENIKHPPPANHIFE